MNVGTALETAPTWANWSSHPRHVCVAIRGVTMTFGELFTFSACLLFVCDRTLNERVQRVPPTLCISSDGN